MPSGTQSASTFPVVGRPLPALTLPSTAGAEVRTKGYKQRQPFLLLLTHDLGCAQCAAWVRALADMRSEVDEVGAAVLLVAPGDVEALRREQARLDLPFTVLADADGTKSQAFLAPDERVALYAVDRYGYVLARWGGDDANVLPAPALPLVRIRDAEQEDCGCGLPAWPEETLE